MIFSYEMNGLPLETGDILCMMDGAEATWRGRVWTLIGGLIPGEVDHVLMYVGPGSRFVELGRAASLPSRCRDRTGIRCLCSSSGAASIDCTAPGMPSRAGVCRSRNRGGYVAVPPTIVWNRRLCESPITLCLRTLTGKMRLFAIDLIPRGLSRGSSLQSTDVLSVDAARRRP